MQYYLKCAKCGEQVHYRETGTDADGFVIIEVWPCDHCQAKKGGSMEQFRVEDVQKVTLNGRKVKLFKAYEYDPGARAYIFCGQFEAPQNTPQEQLVNHIPQEAI